MNKYIDAKWHYPKMGEYPIKYEKYMQQNYPQIPCLVLYNGMYGVRFWNCTEECWDDEECDDFFCDKESVEKWLYIDALDSLQQEQPEADLEKEIERGWEELEKDYSPSALDKSHMIVSGLIGEKQFSRIARHFYELGLNARKEEK